MTSEERFTEPVSGERAPAGLLCRIDQLIPALHELPTDKEQYGGMTFRDYVVWIQDLVESESLPSRLAIDMQQLQRLRESMGSYDIPYDEVMTKLDEAYDLLVQGATERESQIIKEMNAFLAQYPDLFVVMDDDARIPLVDVSPYVGEDRKTDKLYVAMDKLEPRYYQVFLRNHQAHDIRPDIIK